jgi:hypothetical protein
VKRIDLIRHLESQGLAIGMADCAVDELEPSLQRFADFLLKSNITSPKTAPCFVRWVRRFLTWHASADSHGDQIRQSEDARSRKCCCQTGLKPCPTSVTASPGQPHLPLSGPAEAGRYTGQARLKPAATPAKPG